MIGFKFLAPGAVAPFSGFRWPVPGQGLPGRWVEAVSSRPELGIHACRSCDLAYWLDAELWRAELSDPVVESQRQLVASKGRLLERVSAWDGDMPARFAEQTALMARDHVLAALGQDGSQEDASELSRCADLRGLLAASNAMTQSPGRAASLAAYLVEAAETALAGDFAMSAYISARAAVPSSGGDEREFAAERARQAGWLVGELEL